MTPHVALAQAPASATISVKVFDAVDNRPLEAALVGFPELARLTLTNSSGTAVLVGLPSGDYRLEVTVLGYGKATDTLHVATGEFAEYEVAMNVQPFEIEGITVDGKLRWSSSLQRSGFYARSQSGVGRFFDREDLKKRFGVASTLGQALRGRLVSMCQPGYDLGVAENRGSYGFGNAMGPLPTQTMGMAGLRGSGQPVVIVEGVEWSASLDDIPYDWVEGVEIYRSSANLPAQYAGFGLAPCGVIIVWMAR